MEEDYNRNKGLLIVLSILCIISTIILIYQYYSDDLSRRTIMQILLAVLPTIGVIVVAIINIRSGNKKIDENYSETKGMAPKVDQTLRYAEKNNNYIVENFAGKIDKLVNETEVAERRYDSVKGRLRVITDEIEYRKRLAMEYSNHNKDLVVNSVEGIYKENAMLIKENRELKEKNQKLEFSLNQEIEKNRQLKDEIIKYRNNNKEIQKYKDYDIEI